MKKMLLAVAVLLISAPVFAGTISFTATPDPGNGTCTITYTVTEGTANPVAMALDVDVTSGGPIASIDGMDSFFDVFIDSAYDMEQVTPGSYTYDPESPVGVPSAEQDEAGQLILPSSNFCISMGGLGGLDGNNLASPPATGTVAVLHANVDSSGEITLNQLRGGIVDTEGEYMQIAEGILPLAFEITVIPPCFPDTPDYADQYAQYMLYRAEGIDPNCWCGPPHDDGYQCDGDANNDENYFEWRVYSSDVARLADSWKALITDENIDPCADFAHDENYFGWRVYTTDLGILVDNWKALTDDLPGDCPRPDPVE
jgi:hypothetical protein